MFSRVTVGTEYHEVVNAIVVGISVDVVHMNGVGSCSTSLTETNLSPLQEEEATSLNRSRMLLSLILWRSSHLLSNH